MSRFARLKEALKQITVQGERYLWRRAWGADVTRGVLAKRVDILYSSAQDWGGALFMNDLKRALAASDDVAVDQAFHRLLPVHIQRMARLHWTPASVVRHTVDLLQPVAGERFLDVGAGPGKFCVLAALLSPARFVGVEQSASLISLAQACAQAAGTANASFTQGDALAQDWSGFAGIYLYNPFEEPLFGHDAAKPIGSREAYAARVSERLCDMPVGTRVVQFHTFGAELPSTYVRMASRQEASGSLELWVRRH